LNNLKIEEELNNPKIIITTNYDEKFIHGLSTNDKMATINYLFTLFGVGIFSLIGGFKGFLVSSIFAAYLNMKK
jgi:hypothetical protein